MDIRSGRRPGSGPHADGVAARDARPVAPRSGRVPREVAAAALCYTAAVAPYRHRVLYGDTDQMGVVYYATYLRFFEGARGEWIRQLGLTYAQIEESGIYLPVLDVGVRYLKPARYDEAPMLYIGEKVGRGNAEDPEVDIALDPLEGTTITATGGPNALSVIAMADKGNLLNAPDTYMDKIAVGPSGAGAIDLRRSPTQNLRAVADKKGVYVEDLTVIILNRPRHDKLIAEVRQSGARIKLIGDGDVSAAIATCFVETGVDVLMGIGGAPEGVIAAAALRCCGGDMQGRLAFRNDKEIERARKMGIGDPQ